MPKKNAFTPMVFEQYEAMDVAQPASPEDYHHVDVFYLLPCRGKILLSATQTQTRFR